MFESATRAPRFKAGFPIKLPSMPFRGGGLISLLFKLLLVVSPLLFLRACVITCVAPDQIGMRQIAFGPNKGRCGARVRSPDRRRCAPRSFIATSDSQTPAISRNSSRRSSRKTASSSADILIRQYDYPDTFQALTEQKKIQDQSVLTNRALAKQAEADMRLKQTAAQGQNLISIKTAEFQAQITGINAQRDLDQRSRRAEADLLVRQAEAQGTELINRAACTPHQTGATEVGIRFNKITRASSTSPVRSTTSAASYSWCSRSASIAAAASTMKPKTA